MKKLLLISGVLFGLTLLTLALAPLPLTVLKKKSNGTELKFQDGDLIFQSSESGQSQAIQLATKSKYTHCGIIFIENGKPVVYHAVQPVKKSSLEDFAAMGNGGIYWVKRVKNRSAELSPEEIAKMKTEAQSMIGKNYDIYFNWGDDEIYCSEYIWKIYKRGAGIEIGPLKAMKEFDLSSEIVKQIMKKRYGSKLPLEEKMVSPGDIYNSPILEELAQ